jgi:hypothetical protein
MKASADRTVSDTMLTMPGWVSVHRPCTERGHDITYHNLGLRTHSRHFQFDTKLRSPGRGAWRLRKQGSSASDGDEKDSHRTFISSRPHQRFVAPSGLILYMGTTRDIPRLTRFPLARSRTTASGSPGRCLLVVPRWERRRCAPHRGIAALAPSTSMRPLPIPAPLLPRRLSSSVVWRGKTAGPSPRPHRSTWGRTSCTASPRLAHGSAIKWTETDHAALTFSDGLSDLCRRTDGSWWLISLVSLLRSLGP